MEKSSPKHSELVSRLALGTAQFGLDYGIANKSGRVSNAEIVTILDVCAFNGIDVLDTAIAYGGSESSLGNVGVDKFNIVTKLPKLPKGCIEIANWVQDEVFASLKRLGVSKIYGLLFHHSQDLIGQFGPQLYDAMQALKEHGFVEKIGVSIYTPQEMDRILKRFSLDIVQAPLNLVDRRLVDSGLLSRLKEFGIEVHIRSIFLQGLLLLNPADIPPQFHRWNDLWRVWNNWLKDVKLTPVEACLAYPLSLKGIDRIIVGADNSEQLLQIIELVEKIQTLDELPSISSTCEDLINPSRWKSR